MAREEPEGARHVSFRMPERLRERLDRAARRGAGETRSQLALRLIDEGLRMEAHPGIAFRPGPAGRRPGLVGGPDVWEVARVLRELPTGERGLAKAAELTGLALHQIRAAARYYNEYADEIDSWIDEVDRLADELRPQTG